MCRSLGRKKRDSELSEEVEDEVFFLLFKASITFNSLSLSRTLLLLRSPRSFLVESSEGFYLNMRFASAAVSSSPPLAAAAVRSRRSSSSTAVAVSSMPSRRRFANTAASAPFAALLRVSAFQGGATGPATARPAMASASSFVSVRMRVTKRIPFGHTISVVGVGAPALGWEASKSKALTWAEGDVWSGEISAERG